MTFTVTVPAPYAVVPICIVWVVYWIGFLLVCLRGNPNSKAMWFYFRKEEVCFRLYIGEILIRKPRFFIKALICIDCHVLWFLKRVRSS